MSLKLNTGFITNAHSNETLFVSFPAWSISDGNYDPFQQGQKVNFALNIEKANIRKAIKNQCYLKQRKFSIYSFCARVIGNYSQKGMDGHFLVLETGLYKFFIHNYSNKSPYQLGEFIVGSGEIEVDYFIWGEQSYKIPNVPDIYFDFVIEKILHIKFPVRYIYENDDVIISRTSFSSTASEYEIVEIQNMALYSDERVKEINEKWEDDNIISIDNPSFFLFILNKS